jgi:hypothetical protein
MTPIHMSVVTSLAELRALQAEWEWLQEEVDRATVFQTWAWIVSWYEHFGRETLLQIMVSSSAGRSRRQPNCVSS